MEDRNKYQIAIPLPAATLSEMVSEGIRAVRELNRADVLEFRIDSFTELPSIQSLAFFFPLKKKILTNRERGSASPNPQEGFRGKEEERIAYLQNALDSGYFQYVDVELDSIRKIKKSSNGTQLIVSYHDFQKTPSEALLYTTYKSIVDSGADVVKIATTANAREDAGRILRLAENYASEKPLVAFAMGALGRRTRILSPVYGCAWTFARLPGSDGTASGQLTPSELRREWKKIEKRE